MEDVFLIILVSAAVSALTTKIITANHLKKIDSYFEEFLENTKEIVIEFINKQK